MSSYSWPNFNQWIQTAWGAGMEYWQNSQYYGASNLVFGQNPPYYLDDFLATNPKFFGQPTYIAGCSVVAGSNQITVPAGSLYGLSVGQFLTTGAVMPLGTVVTAFSGTTLTVSTTAGASNANFTITVYEAAPLPAFVVQLYVNLANSSLQSARWQEQWYVAMGWFTAHYCTLYCQTDESSLGLAYQSITHGEAPQPVAGDVTGTLFTLSSQPPGQALQSLTVNGLYQQVGADYALAGAQITFTAPPPSGAVIWATWQVQSAVQTSVAPTGAQIAAQGLAGGIQTSKSVGDVSVSYQTLDSLKDWGQWNLTKYGQMLATMAKTMGSGPMVVW